MDDKLYGIYKLSCKEIMSSKEDVISNLKYEIDLEVEQLLLNRDLDFLTINEYFDSLYERLINVEATCDEMIRTKLKNETDNFLSVFFKELYKSIESVEIKNSTGDILNSTFNNIDATYKSGHTFEALNIVVDSNQEFLDSDSTIVLDDVEFLNESESINEVNSTSELSNILDDLISSIEKLEK